MAGTSKPLFRHRGVSLLRAAAVTADDIPTQWPDLTDAESCRAWLQDVWTRFGLVEAIHLASSDLAARVEVICVDGCSVDRSVRRATMSTMRYLLRAIGRHTPFGLFAGATPVSIGSDVDVRWGDDHQPVLRVDTQWLLDVVEQLEACDSLLNRLDVVDSNLVVRRGDRLEVPQGPGKATIRQTKAVEIALDAAASPIRFETLAAKVTAHFPGADAARVRGMLVSLVQQGFLITSLRAPLTVTDPLAHVIARLHDVGAAAMPAAAERLRALTKIEREVSRHNDANSTSGERRGIRTTLTGQMRQVSGAGRVPLAANLRLDCEIRLPEYVAREMERAAGALLRLTRQPTGEAVWRDYYTAFCERYGVDTLVPLAEVVDPGAGLGLPATYPGSVMPTPTSAPSERDARLLALAWQAIADGQSAVVLTDRLIDSLAVGDAPIERAVPAHVEVAARLHAPSIAALECGDYALVIHPARSAGTLTSRFSHLVPDAHLDAVYRNVPVGSEHALPVQLSFPPLYAHAENVCRVPTYLPHVLSLGEHRGGADNTIPLDDLAVIATHDGLQLVSISRQRVVEPQVFHALALDKQPPPLARFLAHLPRALGVAWHEFEWGPLARQLPYLPRVRYRRAILARARWRLTADDLPPANRDDHAWGEALETWRRRWRCPEHVELVDTDRSLPLSLTEPAHVALVRAHIARQGEVTFAEAATGNDLGWIGGHAHDIVLPLFSTQPARPSPLEHSRPTVTNQHGQVPGASDSMWIFAKLFTHPERMDELIAMHLPPLLEDLNEPDYWFARYRSAHETDHLRLRLHATATAQYQAAVATVGTWAQRLRRESVAGRLTIDTYIPETGRYGHDLAMAAAEKVFVADSRLVAAQLRHLPGGVIHPSVLAAVNMVGTAEGFLGSRDAATHWLTAQPASHAVADRILARGAVDLIRGDVRWRPQGWRAEVETAWQARSRALMAYHGQLTGADLDTVLESLLHMHHNRALGVDRDGEAICRHLARQAALAWQVKQKARSL